MRLASQWHERGQRDFRCVFIEADPAHANSLRGHLTSFQNQGLTAVVLEGDVQDHLQEAWKMVGGAPVITFIDPFGIAMPHHLMTELLLVTGRANPSEVLLNINVEAVSRLGGWLEERCCAVVPRPEMEKGVERVDRFLGDTWWRSQFFEARRSHEGGSAAAAAESVIAQYRNRTETSTGCSSISIPIRRRPGHHPLFHLTLFYRHPVAGYKFADAAARATRKWRDEFRAEELADALTPADDTLFDFTSQIQELHEAKAKQQERVLREESASIIMRNIGTLIASRGRVTLADDIVTIPGTTLSLAGEPEIRRAWDQLAKEGVVQARDKSKNMHRLNIVAMR